MKPIIFINRHYPHDTATSQFIVGFIIACVGIAIAKYHSDGFFHYVCDFLGYGVHGIGFTNCHQALSKMKIKKN